MNLANSDHLHALIRAGHLYLTVEDAIALAIENNLDLEVDRYGPLNAEWALQRAQGGGPLRGVTNGSSLVNQVTSGQGVVGSEVSGWPCIHDTPEGRRKHAVPPSRRSGRSRRTWTRFFKMPRTSPTQPSPQPLPIVSQTDRIDQLTTRDRFLRAAGTPERRLRSGERNEVLLETECAHRLFESIGQLRKCRFTFATICCSGFGAGVNGRFIRVAQKNVQARTGSVSIATTEYCCERFQPVLGSGN